MPRPDRPGYSPLTRGSRPDRNLLGLPDGPWFPWSREFRWDLMPWNRNLRRGEQEHRQHRELLHLVEAAAGTIGVVARDAGFEFNMACAGTNNDDVVHSVLYEASPREFADRFRGHAEAEDPYCIDLWVHWYPDHGHLEVDVLDFGGVHGLRMPDRPDLVDATRQRVDDTRRLHPALEAWSEAFAAWLREGSVG